MNLPDEPNPELERRLAAGLLDVLIRAGLVLALVMLCYAIFSPFVSLMAWSMILAVTLYPAHQKLARRMGDGQGLAATLLVLAGIVVVVAPTSLLMGMMGDSVHNFVIRLQDHTLQIPAPWPSVAEVPIVGGKVHDLWTRAHADLPAFLQGIQPTIADLSLKVLAAVASLGGSALLFLFSFIIAGIIMAFGRSGARAMTAIFIRLAGSRARRGTGQAVHRHHSCRGARRARCRPHPGDRVRPGAAARQRSVCRGAHGHRADSGHRPDPGAADHPAGDRLHLVRPEPTAPGQPSRTPCCCSSAACSTTC